MYQSTSVNYPLIADEDLKILKLYNMLPAEEEPGKSRTAMTNATVRSVFLIDPEKNQNDAHISYDNRKKL